MNWYISQYFPVWLAFFLPLLTLLAHSLFINASTHGVASHELLSVSAPLSANFYDTLYSYATYSAIAYYTEHNRVSLGILEKCLFGELCFPHTNDSTIEYIYKGDVSASVIRDVVAKHILLAIKVTTSSAEWVLDFKALRIPYHPLWKRRKG